jgi:hypothetical protein
VSDPYLNVLTYLSVLPDKYWTILLAEIMAKAATYVLMDVLALIANTFCLA